MNGKLLSTFSIPWQGILLSVLFLFLCISLIGILAGFILLMLPLLSLPVAQRIGYAVMGLSFGCGVWSFAMMRFVKWVSEEK